MPEALGTLLEAAICPGAGGGDVDPLLVPPAAPVGTDVAPLDAVRLVQRRECGRHLPRRGLIACGGRVQREGVVWALDGACLAATSACALLGAPGGRRGMRGLGCERPVPPFMAAVWLGVTRFNALWQEAQAPPPRGEL